MEDRTIIILRAKKCLSCEPGGVCWTGGWSNLCLCCIWGANGQGWRIWNPGLFVASALEIELNTWNSAPSSVNRFCCPDLVFLVKSLHSKQYNLYHGLGSFLQGIGGSFVKGIEGCFFNVMGFPVHRYITMSSTIWLRTAACFAVILN